MGIDSSLYWQFIYHPLMVLSKADHPGILNVDYVFETQDSYFDGLEIIEYE